MYIVRGSFSSISSLVSYEISQGKNLWLKCWNYFMKMTDCLYYYIYLLQVVIGGRNKYLINGCNANNTRVQDLFRSVQLNVNNPHFLIMQVQCRFCQS